MNIIRACWETYASVQEAAKLCHISEQRICEEYRKYIKEQNHDAHMTEYYNHLEDLAYSQYEERQHPRPWYD